ncbi:MAG: hypothetical protein ACFB02_05120 [Mastigocoleus sp.]
MKVLCDSTGITNRLGLKSQAHKPSPLKWAEDFSSPLQRTLAISPEIDFRVDVVDCTE